MEADPALPLNRDVLMHKGQRIELNFERYSFPVDPFGVQTRKYCTCCPVPQNAVGRFCLGCCLPFTCFCFKPYVMGTSRGGTLMFMFLFVIFLGALFFWGVEGYNECVEAGLPFPDGLVKWNYGNSVYFMVITLTTIGYGDFSPSTIGGKVFVIFFGSLGLAVVAAVLGYFTSILVDALRDTRERLAPALRRRGCNAKFASFVSSWRLALILTSVYVFLLIVGAVLFGWSQPFQPPKFLNGLYFSFVTLSTIGYGDLLPTHAGTRLWAVLYALIGVGLWGFIIGNIANSFSEGARLERKKRRKKKSDHGDVNPERLRAILIRLDEVRADIKKSHPREKRLVKAYAREIFHA